MSGTDQVQLHVRHVHVMGTHYDMRLRAYTRVKRNVKADVMLYVMCVPVPVPGTCQMSDVMSKAHNHKMFANY